MLLAPIATEFCKIKQNNGYYAIHGHSRSQPTVPQVDSPYVTFY